MNVEDRYWALIDTRNGKQFVEGAVRIIAGRTSVAELTDEETQRIIRMVPPRLFERTEEGDSED